MDRTRPRKESLPLAEPSAEATTRGGYVRAVARWFFALSAHAGLALVVLAVAFGMTAAGRRPAGVFAGSSASSSRSVAANDVSAAEASADDGGTAEASKVPCEGRERLRKEGEPTAESETKDDEDARSHASAPACVSRDVRIAAGRAEALRAVLEADTGRPLVSNGLARGPPFAS